MSRGWAKASACRLQMTLSCNIKMYLQSSSSHLRSWMLPCVNGRVGVDYKSPITITITITVPIKLSITITITVVIEKAITITITIIRLRLQLRLQLLVYHGNDSRLFIRHVHLKYYHA